MSGSFLSLIFVFWCFSGIVLIFDGFPHASREERFLHLAEFSPEALTNLQAPSETFKGNVSLEISDGNPVYRVRSGRKSNKVFDARTLMEVPVFTEAYAQSLTESFNGHPVRKIERMDDLSQWVPWNYYKPLLPFYKCYMADKEHTVLYVSAKTGEIIQETKRLERWSARLGAIPHWIYFKQLRSLEKTWRLVVIILASLGILMTVTGIYAGVIRYRKRSKNSITPYKKFWYKWHHITGFFFGFFVFTFVLSGLISVSSIPDWMVGVKKSDKVKVGWNQKLDLRMHHHTTPWNIYKALDNKDGVRKIEWKSVLGQAQYHVYYEDYQKPDVYTLYNDSVIPQRPYSMSDIQSQANILLGQIPFSIQEQFTYDNYYAGSGMIYLPQPAYKIMVDDVANTWLYIDPASGEAVKTLTRNTRLRRWLYRFLHTLDIPMLKKMDGLRKTILVLLCLMGLAISVTGFVIGIKWFKRNLGW